MGNNSRSGSILPEVPKVKDKPFHTQLASDLASVFSYETGFYYNGKRQYEVDWCAGITVIFGILLFWISIVIFHPFLSNDTVFSEVKVYSFNTPADIPLKGLIPSGLA